jgi:hypothetical protein
MKTYKIINGTSYDDRTPDAVVSVLEHARLNRTRLHISLGDTETGRDWLDEFETYGYVGRSSGTIKVPLMIANRRSIGGGAILDHCIVRIRTSAGGRVLFQHPRYHHGQIEVRQKPEPLILVDGRVLRVDVFRDDQVQAAFENVSKAIRYIKKLGICAEINAK